MASQRSMKDKEMAATLKKRGVVRDSGTCPWGCGRLLHNGGQHLSRHLSTCTGPKKGRKNA